jgi:transposase
MTYSHDLRTKALDYIEKGRSKVETSQVFGVTVQTLIGWCKRKRQGNLAPNTTKTRQPQKLETEKLKAYIEKHPDSYLREIAEEFKVTITAVFYACKRLKITLKKRRPFTGNEMRMKEKSFERN